MNVPYLDGSFLSSPMWDSAEDYCHHDGKVLDPEILYLTAAAVGSIVDEEFQPTLLSAGSS